MNASQRQRCTDRRIANPVPTAHEPRIGWTTAAGRAA
jgi:hypothetical protein